MGKKIKLSLEDLKVQSFVTSVDSQQIVGGLKPTDPQVCGTNGCSNVYNCDSEACSYGQSGCGTCFTDCTCGSCWTDAGWSCPC